VRARSTRISPAGVTEELALQQRWRRTHHQRAHLRQHIGHVLIVRDGHQENFGSRTCQLKNLFLGLLEGAEDSARARVGVAHHSWVSIGARLSLIQRAPKRDRHRDDQGPVVLRRIQERPCPSNLNRVIATHNSVSERTVIHHHHGGLSCIHDLFDLSRIDTSVCGHRQVDGREPQACRQARHMHMLGQRLIRMKHHSEVKQLVHEHSSRPGAICP